MTVHKHQEKIISYPPQSPDMASRSKASIKFYDGPVHGPGDGPDSHADHLSYFRPSSTELANILQDFYEESENEDTCSEEGEADDEEEEDNYTSLLEGVENGKVGERYTELDFGFIEEEWLQLVDDSNSEDDESSFSD